MPLLPKLSDAALAETVEVEIDGDVYWLRRHLSIPQVSRMDALSDFIANLQFHTRQETDQEKFIKLTADMEKAINELIHFWIVRWSHDDDLTLENVARIPPKGKSALSVQIRKLMQEARGIDPASPLPTASPKSSPSSETESETASA